MRRGRNQCHSWCRVSQFCNEFRNLEARQLPALARLGTLRDLDFDFLSGPQIFCRDAEASARNLLDRRIGIVAVGIGFEARRVLAALARHRLCANAVHRNRQSFVRLGAECAQRHSRRDKSFAYFSDRLDLVDYHGLLGVVEFEEIAKIDGREIADAAGKLQVGRIAVRGDRCLQQVHQLRGIGMGLAPGALAIKAADGQRCHTHVECRLVSFGSIYVE